MSKRLALEFEFPQRKINIIPFQIYMTFRYIKYYICFIEFNLIFNMTLNIFKL